MMYLVLLACYAFCAAWAWFTGDMGLPLVVALAAGFGWAAWELERGR